MRCTGRVPDLSPRLHLGLTDAEVLGHRLYLPDQRLVGTFRLYFLALKLHSVARLHARGVAKQRVSLLVFFVGDSHPASSWVDTSRNRSLFGRFVNDHNSYDYHGRSNPHDGGRDPPA